MMKVRILMCLAAALMSKDVYGLPSEQNNSTIVTKTVEENSCGHVTNVIVHGNSGTGEAGPQGERGPPGERGPQGEKGDRGFPGRDAPSAGGVVFTRWGRTACPGGTELLYQGTTAGSHREEAGSAEYLCLHQQPQFLATNGGLQPGRGRLWGTEYENIDNPPAFGSMNGHDAPCAVCYAPTRIAKVMIPARTSCPPSWTREYYGYLMADKHVAGHHSRVPICMDVHAQSVPGSSQTYTGSIVYFMETTCNGIRCPPYFNGAEITCAVCTK